MPVVVLDTQIVNGKAVHTDPLSKKKFTAPTRKSKGSKPARPPIKEKDNNEPTDNRPILVRLFSKKQKAPVHFKPFTLIPPVASTAAAPKAASKQHRSGASAAALKRLINGPLKRPKAPTPKQGAHTQASSQRAVTRNAAAAPKAAKGVRGLSQGH